MTGVQTFPCFLVGNGALALRCAEALLQAGHQVLGVYSRDGSLRSWSEAHAVPHPDTRRSFKEALLAQPYDFLFSVNNPWILPPEVIQAARRSTINFHDSPLPKYAGLHATSWALIHGETSHATTWHEVVPEIDAGPILKQVVFPIEPDDTALSVNTRVFELTLEAFKSLVGELAGSTQKAVGQPTTGGSYFSRADRPAAACLLSPTESANTLRDLVRGLDFGPALNPLGRAKVRLSGGYVAVSGVRVVATRRSAEPGTVLGVSEGSLSLSVGDADVQLIGLESLEGQPQSQAHISALGAVVGERLSALAPAESDALSAYNASVCTHEGFWRRRLSSLRPFVHPLARRSIARSPEAEVRRYPIVPLREFAADDALLSYCAAYFVRLGSGDYFDVGLFLDGAPELADPLFSAVVPLRVSRSAEDGSWDAFRARFATELGRARRFGGIARDLISRDPSLRAVPEWPSLPVVLALLDTPQDLTFSRLDAQLGLVCYRDGSTPELVHAGALRPWHEHAIADQLGCVARACSRDPSQLVRRLPLLSEAERNRILHTWNDTAAPYPDSSSVDELIARQAELTPDELAVKFGDSLSYAELEARANQVAREVRSRGVEPGDLVALCLPRSVDLLVGLLGIVKSGAAYVPIDPTYPTERVRYLVEDSGAECVVTTEELRVRHFPGVAHALCMDRDAERIGLHDRSAVESGVGSEGVLYMIYTSGSTGRPKGVGIRHGSLVNHSWAIANTYDLGVGDRMLQSASLSFDIAAEQIFPPLFRGSTVVIRPEDLLESFKRFEAFAVAERLTAMILPTAFWHEWVSDLEAADRQVPEELRVLSVGTEKALGHRLDVWERQSGGRVAFFQGYGPTETTITCTMYVHRPGTSFGVDGEIPIGEPLPNTELYVLDADLEPVPVGVPGELFVGGRGVGVGYHGREELTAERFVPNPFKPENGSRLYRTGDLVRWDPSGQLVFMGRNDFQIKVRGIRVEIGEIEAALEARDDVEHAIVHPKLDGRGRQRLVAYVVPRGGALDPEALLADLAASLPSFMVPSAAMNLDAFPMTPNLKVDRAALPLPTSLSEGLVKFDPPADDLEVQVAAIWQRRLGVERVGRHDNFFDLGGDSLRAVALLDEMSAATGVPVGLSHIFATRTLAELCQLMRDAGAELVPAVIPLGSQSELEPIFFICGIQLYQDLARQIGSHHASYGVFLPEELRLFEAGSAVQLDVIEHAALYLNAIRAQQPHGPYRLGGVSFGGVLAYEIARQLRAAGEDVALLALFDALLPSGKKRSLQRGIGSVLGAVRRDGVKVIGRKVKKLLRPPEVPKSQDPVQAAADRLEARRNAVYLEAMDKYDAAPRPYSGRVVLFRAADRVGMESVVIDPLLGWGRHALGEVIAHDAAGDHLEMVLEPAVGDLATKLKPYLKAPRR